MEIHDLSKSKVIETSPIFKNKENVLKILLSVIEENFA